MARSRNVILAEFKQFVAELERVCPEAAGGLAVGGAPPPMLNRRDLIAILQTLPADADVHAFVAAWQAFAAANPGAVIDQADT